jgi:hypothetical protein
MLERTTELYRLAEHPVAYRTPVADVLLRSYAEAVAEVADAFGPEADEPWATLVRAAKGARWRLLTVPLPASDIGAGLAPSADVLHRWSRVAAEVHGQRAGDAAVRASDLLDSVIARGESPLATAVAGELAYSADSRLFLATRRADAAVGAWLAKQGLTPDIAHTADAGELAPVELACAVGAARWHPAHLVTAPRAQTTAFIHHDWIREAETASGLFGASGGLSVRIRWIGPPPTGPDARDLEDQPEWGAIARHGGDSGAEPDEVEALIVVVAGGKRVLLETGQASSILVVEPGAPRDARVRRERVRDLSAGDFILLRTDRGRDDVIRVIADRILGTAAPELRSAQARWKELLNARVAERGYATALRDLEKTGVAARNLRGWLSPDSIRPERSRDFELILAYCGIGSEAAVVWQQMERLDQAHLRAGQQLRRLLEDRIEDGDLAALRTSGYLAVTLSIPGAGSLGIFRIEAIAPDRVLVPASSLYVVQDLPEDLWPG